MTSSDLKDTIAIPKFLKWGYLMSTITNFGSENSKKIVQKIYNYVIRNNYVMTDFLNLAPITPGMNNFCSKSQS